MMQTKETIRLFTISPIVSGDQPPPELSFGCLGAADRIVCHEKQYIASRKIKKLHLIEIRGNFDGDWFFELLPPDCFWLQLQLLGQSQRDGKSHTLLSAGEYQGFHHLGSAPKIQVKAGKTVMLLLGIHIKDGLTFSREWPLLKRPGRNNDQPTFSRIHIGYRIKQVLEKIEAIEDSPFSLHGKLLSPLYQLLDLYQQDLRDKIRSQHKEDIVLYNEAVAYIYEHYREPGINRDSIAAHLNIGIRTLYRVFKDKNTSIHGSIQTIRLYKAREMLQKTERPIDDIAFHVGFSTTKYFDKQYTQRFGHSPGQEREMYHKRKKKRN